MTDVVVPTSPWTALDQSLLRDGDRLVAPRFGTGDGQRAVVLVTSTIDTVGKRLAFDATVCLRAAAKLTTGIVQVRSDGCEFHGEVDCAGLASQGVQVLQWKGQPAGPPTGTNFDGAYIHDVADNPGDTNGMNHAIYLQDSRGATGTNVRLARIPRGSGIQCDPSDGVGVSTGARFDRVDILDAFQGAFFWGAATDNLLAHVYCPTASPNRGQYHPGEYPVLQGGGAFGNTFDYVATPTPGYGAGQDVPVDVAAVAAAVEQHLRQTKVSYETWRRNLDAGKYPELAATHWGAAFAGLDQLQK